MNCLRCGRENQEDHVFCESCRKEMEKYPVRPGTAVMLPRKREEVSIKKTKRHVHPQVPLEEQVRKLKKQRMWLIIALLVIVTVLSGTFVIYSQKWNAKVPRPGQNYSTVDDLAPQETK